MLLRLLRISLDLGATIRTVFGFREFIGILVVSRLVDSSSLRSLEGERKSLIDLDFVRPRC